MMSGTGEISVKLVVAAAGILLAAYLLWELRSLVLPILVSSLLAYVCRPLVVGLERRRVPRGAAIGLLLSGFMLTGLFLIDRIQAIVPTEQRLIELKVHALYALNERYKVLMGLDQSLTSGNRLYRLVHADLDPLMDHADELLALAPAEHAQFVASHTGLAGTKAASDRLVSEHQANLTTRKARGRVLTDPRARGRVDQTAGQWWATAIQTPLAAVGDLLSTWIIAPLVFLFLLRDTGEIKRSLLRMVPNRLFEPALRVLADLDGAMGNYLRGMFLACALLGVTLALFFALVGVPLRWAITIGLVGGMTNVVPYLGSAIALLAGLSYALFAEDIYPVLPMVNVANLAMWIVVAVACAEIIKNTVYEPLVLGGAVKLHPLVIVIGVVGGSIMFGFAGVLLAIPTMAVCTVFISSTSRHLKAYGLL
jgi:predicted PurR-regulated permease PerM